MVSFLSSNLRSQNMIDPYLLRVSTFQSRLIPCVFSFVFLHFFQQKKHLFEYHHPQGDILLIIPLNSYHKCNGTWGNNFIPITGMTPNSAFATKNKPPPTILIYNISFFKISNFHSVKRWIISLKHIFRPICCVFPVRKNEHLNSLCRGNPTTTQGMSSDLDPDFDTLLESVRGDNTWLHNYLGGVVQSHDLYNWKWTWIVHEYWRYLLFTRALEFFHEQYKVGDVGIKDFPGWIFLSY